MKLNAGGSRIIPLSIFFLIAGSCLFAQQEKRFSFGEQEIFKASKANSPITIDGRIDEEAWLKSESRSLDYHYRVEKPTDQQHTVFRMLWDEENLYVFFDCQDQYITARETKRDGRPYLDDCAEIFLISAPDSCNMHYGFELNLYKASNDFIYIHHFPHL